MGCVVTAALDLDPRDLILYAEQFVGEQDYTMMGSDYRDC